MDVAHRNSVSFLRSEENQRQERSRARKTKDSCIHEELIIQQRPFHLAVMYLFGMPGAGSTTLCVRGGQSLAHPARDHATAWSSAIREEDVGDSLAAVIPSFVRHSMK